MRKPERHEFDSHGAHDGATCCECHRLHLNTPKWEELRVLIYAALDKRPTPTP